MGKKTRFEVVPLASVVTLLGQVQQAGTPAKSGKILSVTFDRMLGATREMLFTQAGFQVKTVSDIGHAIQLCAAEPFDLIVIGHSIPIQQRELLLKEVRRQCGTPTLALCRHGEPPLTNADHVFDAMASPGLLLETAVEILKSRSQETQKSNGASHGEPVSAAGRVHKSAKRAATRAKRLNRSSV
jgi:DNA-binding NtrC family response regulator